jgi:branched-chain amino acid transport system substrate-binding protein
MYRVSWRMAAVFGLFLAAGGAVAQESIKIVSSLPRTGSSAQQSQSTINGIRMAVDEVGGKVAGFEILVEDLDDASPERGAWDPALEAANADKAIRDLEVVAYIGTLNSGSAKISMPKLNAAGLAMVSPANTWPGLTKPGVGEPNEPAVYRPSGKVTFFRVMPADDIQGRVAAEWAKELGAKKVYLLHDKELYGKGIATIFQKTAEGIGLPVAGFEGIDPRASNYRAVVTKIRQTGADLVFYGGTVQSNAGQLVKDLRTGGLKTVKFMVPDACFERSFIEAAGPQNVNNDTYVTFGGVPPAQLTGKGKEFYDAYKAKFGNEPEGYAVYGYEAAKVVLTAVERAGSKDRAAIIAQIAAIRDFEGALGSWSFDENGDTTLTTMSGNTVEDGAFKFVKLLGAAAK